MVNGFLWSAHSPIHTLSFKKTLVIIVQMANPFVNKAVFWKLKLFNYFNTFNTNLLVKWLLTSDSTNPPILINVCFQYLILVFYISVVNVRECSPAESVSRHKDSGRCIRATGVFEFLGDVSHFTQEASSILRQYVCEGSQSPRSW